MVMGPALIFALPTTLRPVISSAPTLPKVTSPAVVVALKDRTNPPRVVLPTEVVVNAFAEIWLNGSRVSVAALRKTLPTALISPTLRSPTLLNARSPVLVPLNVETWFAPSSVVLPEEVVARPPARMRPLGPSLMVAPLKDRPRALAVPLTVTSPAFTIVAKPLT